MDSKTSTTHKNIFGIHFEKSIWRLGAFVLSKETHKNFQWYLRQTNIPLKISQKTQGQALNASRIGNFEVDWHMAGDLKFLKCMFGYKVVQS